MFHVTNKSLTWHLTPFLTVSFQRFHPTACSLTPSKSFSVRVPDIGDVGRWEVAVVNHPWTHIRFTPIPTSYKVVIFTQFAMLEKNPGKRGG